MRPGERKRTSKYLIYIDCNNVLVNNFTTYDHYFDISSTFPIVCMLCYFTNLVTNDVRLDALVTAYNLIFTFADFMDNVRNVQF